MAYRGFPKPRLRWPKALGFACGLVFGAGVTIGAQSLGSRFQSDSHITDVVCTLFWRLVILPTTLLGLADQQPSSAVNDVGPWELALATALNALLAGGGAALAAHILSRRLQKDLGIFGAPPAPVDLTKRSPGAAAGTSALLGLALGSVGTLSLLLITALCLSNAWPAWWILCIPTRAACRLLGLDWPQYETGPVTIGFPAFIIIISLLNGLFASILLGITAIARHLLRNRH